MPPPLGQDSHLLHTAFRVEHIHFLVYLEPIQLRLFEVTPISCIRPAAWGGARYCTRAVFAPARRVHS
ncbi:hypothetical protein PsYK624_086740 [Phanerochaete sordida]|uniref:Uncharacterized protein n=1 Tax=Phanerochaete sordida TaxID=48140 RepID=A0A9P3GEY0_9APHY|nr:hypothetical protein PsYK624_086740 [Phanerochaete sordida]